MTYIVISGGLVRAEVFSERIARGEAQTLVCQGAASAEIYKRLGVVRRLKVEHEYSEDKPNENNH